ncbi:hypothetical protein BU26DRAFT_548808 [Trematosphaeria pertusa]|uniref:Uncharacterized protein n=1 Tax=Trematosphaeria pertusa TaxID=390896 RepID=A0A6A6IPF2_9PLEO|nr:uncharacterized protein BU26DRAFT_548808 [Trematosphaeria pertusa]KAF2252117.1 hypothetical protein BU26DRAFT_548808 [Trematosphaeria pertusa]
MPSLWESKIPDIETLKRELPGSVLTALDTEGFYKQGNLNPSEIGLAVLGAGHTPRPAARFSAFYEENGVRAFTIRLRERNNRGNEYPYGSVEHANADEVVPIFDRILSGFQGKCILTGFDLHAELKWIALKYPSLATHFTAWVDVQELVWQRCKQIALEPEKVLPFGLNKALKAMHICDWRAKSAHHCASNDAVRALRILIGLATDAPFAIPDPKVKRIPPLNTPAVRAYQAFLSRLPKPNYGKHPFEARVMAVDGSKLPPLTSRSLLDRYAGYVGLKAVGLNWQTEAARSEGVRIWWASLLSQESLDNFARDNDGSTLNGIQLRVVTSGKPHLQAQQARRIRVEGL